MPEAKGVGRKLGPLPLWAWLLIGAGGALGVWLLLRSRGQAEAVSPVELVTGARARPEDLPFGGYPSAATPPAQMLSSDIASELVGVFGALGGAISDLYALQATSLTEQASALDKLQQTVAEATLAPPVPWWIVNGPWEPFPPVAPSEPVRMPKPPTVRWGGQTFKTKVELERWLRPRGASYTVWAQRHPEAAARLKGPVPKLRPKPRPRLRSRHA